MARKCRPHVLDGLEPRRLFAAAPLGINLNDEALWTGNFDVAVAQAKKLGVQSVRLWFGFQSYDERPNAWAPYTPYGAVALGEVPANEATGDTMSRTMTRAFELKRAGFNVLAILQNVPGESPASATQAKGFVRHLMDATETPDGMQTLKDVIDYWEIGNEPDSANYWLPSGVNKTAGLKAYVNDWLIPAAEELHAGAPGQWEPVVSAGVSYSPADLNTIIGELQTQNALDAVDYLGFHPYGVVNSTTNDIARNTAAALSSANAVGKQLIASEWNIRGFGNVGANDAAWAKTMDSVYRTTILPNFKEAYYFALVNNWAGRGGTTSARPGGLLKHDTTLAVTPASDVASLRAYYQSPLIAAEPFYGTFATWQFGQVGGTVTNRTTLPAGYATTPATVFIDVNGNGAFDATEPAARTDPLGRYSIRYGTNDLSAGTYTLLVATSDQYAAIGGGVAVALAPLSTATGVDLTIESTPAVLENLGTVTGTLFKDANGNGLFDSGDAALAGWRVYLDTNGNGLLDASEPAALTNPAGAYTFVYDATTIGAASLTVTAVLPSNDLSAVTATVTVGAGLTQTDANVGVRSTLGSIAGVLWNDVSGDGLFNDTDTYTGSRVVFIDANGNGVLDAGERQTTSDATGRYAFVNLPAGTYSVTRVFPAGYRLSNSGTGSIAVTLQAGQDAGDVNIGSTNKPRPAVVPPVVTPTTPATPPEGGTPAAVGTASVAGKLFSQSSNNTAAMLAQAWTAYLDTNGNGVRDGGETAVALKADGTFALARLAAGTYTLRLDTPAGWAVATPTTAAYTFTLKAGQAKTGQNFVIRKVSTTPSTPTAPTTPVTPTTPSATASVSGKLFTQSKLTAAMLTLPWKAYLDANRNGALDAGEIAADVSKSDGTYGFSNLAAGTYTVALTANAGWKITAPTAAAYTITLKAALAKTGQNFTLIK